MKTTQKENGKRKLNFSKKVILRLNHELLTGIIGGHKTSTIPTCVSNEPNCFIRITR